MSDFPGSLTCQDARGVSWAFDPATGKWQARLGEQKSSSQKIETLRDKVGQWLAAPAATGAAAPAKEPEPVSARVALAAMLPFETNDLRVESLLTTSWVRAAAGRRQTPASYIAKTAWSAQAGAVAVERYVSDVKDAAWESRNSGSLLLMRFDALEPEDQDWWSGLMAERAKTQAAVEARALIGRLWLDAKAPATAAYAAQGRIGESRLAPAELGARDDLWIAPAGVPAWGVDEAQAPDGWTSENGAWIRGGVRLSMSISAGGSPSFAVSLDGQRLADSSDHAQMWALAQATAAASDANLPELAFWRVPAQETVGALGWQPDRVVVRAAKLDRSDGVRASTTLRLLGRFEERSLHSHAFASRPAPDFSAPQSFASLSWKGFSRYDLSGGRYHPRGPEDALLGLMAKIDAELAESTRAFRDANAKDDLNARLREQTRASVKAAHNAVVDGEEDAAVSSAHAGSQWTQTLERMADRAQRDPDVQSLRARFDALVGEAQALVASLSVPAVKPRRPAP
jgi:hypothetical protein